MLIHINTGALRLRLEEGRAAVLASLAEKLDLQPSEHAEGGDTVGDRERVTQR